MTEEADRLVGEVQNRDMGSMKVPGATAPHIRVSGLLNSLPRKVLSSKCAFATFYTELSRLPPESGEATSSSWPIPLPYPEVCPRGGEQKACR